MDAVALFSLPTINHRTDYRIELNNLGKSVFLYIHIDDSL